MTACASQAFFVLTGGFCYFGGDEAGRPLLTCNALVLVPSIHMLHFTGPYRPSSRAVQALADQGRLVDVTLDPLEHAGFHAWAWVLPKETLGGTKISKDHESEHGGFVFERRAGDAPAFFALQAPSEEQLAEFLKLQERREHSSWFRRIIHWWEDELDERKKMIRLTVAQEFAGGRHWVLDALWWNPRGVLVLLVPLLISGGLILLAGVSSIAYEIAATFIWYTTFTYVVWTAIQDTTAQATLTDSPWRWLCMHSLLVGIPILMMVLVGVAAAISSTSSGIGGGLLAVEGASPSEQVEIYEWARSGVDMGVEFLSILLLYLGVPLTLYYFRLRIASMLAKRRGEAALVLAATDGMAETGRKDKAHQAQARNARGARRGSIFDRIKGTAPPAAAANRPTTRRPSKKGRRGSVLDRLTPGRAAAQVHPAGAADVHKNARAGRGAGGSRASPRGRAPSCTNSGYDERAGQSEGTWVPFCQAAYDRYGVVGPGVSYAPPPPSSPGKDLMVRVVPPPAAAPVPESATGSSGSAVSRIVRRCSLTRGGGGASRAVAPAPAPASSNRPGGARRARLPSSIAQPGAAAASRASRAVWDEPLDLSEYHTAVALRAATKMQARIRMRHARKCYLLQRERRMAYLKAFSYPIFLTSLIDIFGSNLVLQLAHRGVISENFTLYSLIFTLPSFLVVMIDSIKPKPPRFSLAHCIFFIAVLYRLALRAAAINTQVWALLMDIPIAEITGVGGSIEDGLGVESGYVNAVTWYSMAVPSLTMCCHYALFLTVTWLGKVTLEMVATKNACIHLLFPFQTFDYLFLYAFFSLRYSSYGVSVSWVAQQVLLQSLLVLRNSGVGVALATKFTESAMIKLRMATGGFKKADPNDDPLFTLQTLARMGVQYDIADIAALILTPAVVCVFLWRDGIFLVEGSGILVRPCDWWNMVLRFLVLLIIKPIASSAYPPASRHCLSPPHHPTLSSRRSFDCPLPPHTPLSALARCILMRAMRKTLLGHKTMHGTSAIAAGILAGSQLTRHMRRQSTVKASGKTVGGLTGPDKSLLNDKALKAAKARQHSMRMMRLDNDVDVAVQAKLGLLEEELHAVRDDLTLAGLNFKLLRRKQLRKWRFFASVVVLQVFAAFQCRTSAPMALNSRMHGLQTHVINVPVNASLGIGESVRGIAGRWDNSTVTFKVPRQSVWIHVPVALLAFDVTRHYADLETGLHWVDTSGGATSSGWDIPEGHWICTDEAFTSLR